jgi:UPF0755 protein
VAKQLEQAGLVPSALHFLVSAWMAGALGHLQAGEYAAAPARSTRQWVETLREGRRVRHAITIPEGWTGQQVALRVEKAGLATAREVLQAASSPALLEAYQFPSASGEGYLFPETYVFEKPVSATAVVQIVFREFTRQTRHLGSLSYEQVVLASIIEKEAQLQADMAKVSAVFHNRLRRDQPLQSDATVFFALEQAGRPIAPLDTGFDSPYNTYRYEGLPPTAICNPGLAALDAAVHPATGEWLFFLSDANGEFHFSHSHAEHVRLKQQLRPR